MAGGIKGITVEIGGDTTALGDAIAKANTKAKGLQKELKGVNTLLKQDPGNTTLLAQKQELLTKAVKDTSEKLKMLKGTQKEVQEQFEKGEITEEQFRDFQREIVATEQKLEGLTDELKEFGSVGAQKVTIVGEKIGQVGEKMQDVGGKIEGFGKKLSVVSAASGAILGGSTMLAVEFEDAMAKVHTIADTSAVSLDELSDQIMNLSNETGISATDIANATYDAISAGQNTADAVNFVSNATSLARAGFAETGAALDLLTTIMNAYGMEASEVGNVSDMLIQIQNKGKTTVAQLSSAMGKVIPTANSMNVGLEQLGASYAIMTSKGIATAETTTYVNAMLNELGKSGTDVSDILKKETGKSFQELMGEGKSLGDVLAILQGHAEKNKVGFNDLWSSSEAGKAAITLLSDGVEGFNESVAGMNDSVGSTASALEKLNTPSQKAKEAITRIKNSGIELGQSLLDALAPTIEKIAEAIKSLTEKFNSLSPSTKTMIVTVLGVVTVLGPLTIGIGKVITLFGKIISLGPALINLIKTVSTALSSSPWGAVAVAIGLVIGAIVAYTAATKDANAETKKLCEEMDKQTSAIKENTDSYFNAKKARDEAMQGTEHEYAYYQQLLTELTSITDENGRVIEGYETRAQVITGTLSEALGQEITTDQMVAQGKQNIIDKINQLILAKKAEIQLSANEDAYTEAMQKSSQALNDYMTAQQLVTEGEKELAEAKKELAEFEKKLSEVSATEALFTSVAAFKTQQAEYDKLTERVELLTDQQKENNKALSDAEEVYTGYQTTIENYEGLSAAIIEGDAEKINIATSNLVNSFITAENGTEKSLKKQVDNAKKNLANLKNAFKEGTPGVTQAMIDEAQNLVNRATAEYEKLTGNGKTAGEKSGKAVTEGITSKIDGVRIAGVNFSQGFINGMNSKSWAIRFAAQTLGTQAVNGLKTGIKEGSPSRLTMQSGEFFGEGFEIGIKDSVSGVLKSVKKLVSDTKNAFLGREGFDIHSPSRYMKDKVGKELVAGIIKGVNENKDNAKKSARELAELYISETEKTIKNKSDWKEIAIGDEIFLWKELLSKCKKGSEEYKNVEIKLFNAHKEYIENERKLNNMSVEGEKAYWKNLASQCEKGSVLYKYAMEKYGEARTEYEDTYVSVREERLKTLKKTSDISLADEVKYWSNILKQTESTFKGYRDVQQKLVDAHKKYIDELRDNDDMSVQDEMVYWVNLLETFEEGSEAYQSVMNHFKEANKDYESNFVANHAEYIDKKKERGEMSLANEVTYWKKLLKITDRNSKNYLKIQEKIYDAEKELSQKSKELKDGYRNDVKAIADQLETDIQAVKEAYDNAVSTRQKSIVSSMGLFDAFKANAEIDKYTLADNLGSQVEALKEWDATLDALSKRKGLKNSELLTDLQGMGVDSLYTLQQINTMTDEELQNYINLYDEKNKIALERATIENESLKAESQRQIRQLTAEANTQFEELERVYIENMEELGLTATGKFKSIGQDMVQGIIAGMESETSTFQQYITNFLNSAVSTAQSVLDIHSPSRVFAKVIGRQIPAGIAQGILDNSGVAHKAIKDMANGLTDEASLMNGATINRKLNATFTSKLGDGRTLTDIMDTMVECSNKIYDRLNRMQIVLDSGALVGETIEKIDAGLANRQMLTARGV